MGKFSLKVLFLTLVSCTASVNAAPVVLNQAFDFNAYILENMTASHSDVEGTLAVGGDLTAQHYGFGLEVPDNSGKNIITVGGDATIRDARIYNGDAVAAGNIDIDASVGLYDINDTNNTHQFYQDTSFDFGAINADLLSTSSLWGAMPDTASTTINGNGVDVWSIDFTGTSDFNIFSIDAATLSAADKSIHFNFSTDSLNIINVTGDNVSLFNTGFYGADGSKIIDNQPGVIRHDGTYTNNVLFNFVDATSLSLSSIAVKGSILAPLADTVFYNGHIDGNFIVKSLTSPSGTETGQINDYRFGDITFNVNEPATAILFASVLGLLGLRSRSSKRIAL